MKKYLLILATLATLSACDKRVGPDETAVMQGDALRLPPQYVLQEPSSVKTVEKTAENTDIKAQQILFKEDAATMQNEDEKINTWFMNNAGGQERTRNIKQVIKNDNLKQIEE